MRLRKDRLFAAASFALPLAIYLLSLDGDVGFWDTGEMQTVPYIGGIAHPTGYPTFTMLGWLFTHAVPIGSVAWRTTFMCALCYAFASLLLYRFARREGAGNIAALVASVAFALAPAVWQHATHTDVFAVTVLACAAIFALLQSWTQTRATAPLLWAGFLFGVALGNNPIVIWLLPGFACLALWNRQRLRISGVATTIGTALLGLCVYAYLPLRSDANYAARRDPTLALGVPPGRPFWDYAHPGNAHNFWWLVTGAQVNAASSLAHFDGLWTGLPRVAEMMWHGASPLLTLTAILGGAIVVRRSPWWGVALLLFAFASWPFTATFAPETEPVRYLLVPIWLCAAFAAVALNALFSSGGFARIATALACAAILTVEFVAGSGLFVLPRDRLGSTYVRDVVASTHDGSIIVAPWVLATPLGYAAYVERAIGSRVLDVSTVTDDAGMMRRWAAKRPVYAIAYAEPSVGGLTFRFVRRLNVDPNPTKDAKLWRVEYAAP